MTPTNFENNPTLSDTPRDRILAAAKQLFAERGTASTSTRDIAEVAKVNLAMIHYYFGSKEQLYRHVLAQVVGEMSKWITEALGSDLPPAERILSYPITVMKAVRENPAVALIIHRDVMAGGKDLLAVLNQLGEQNSLGPFDEFDAQYRLAVSAGQLRDLPPNAVREFCFLIAYSSVYVEPLRVLSKSAKVDDESVWEERYEAFSDLVRNALSTETGT